MADRISYPPGTPCWVDVLCADAETGRAFYRDLFGWNPELSPFAEAGGYTLFHLDGVVVAGLGPNPGGGLPDAWVTYTSVTDAAASLACIAATGGTVLMGATTVFDQGTMGVFTDPSGIVGAVWQPDAHIGSQRVNQPGAFVWSELSTPDVAGATAFYGEVFGWEPSAAAADGAVLFSVDGRVVCGAHETALSEFAAWAVWFGVDDCDAAAARAETLGGLTVLPPMPMGFGRGALIAAPGGAVFGIGAVDNPAG